MTDIRVCNTPDLIELNRRAIANGYSRTLGAQALADTLDRNGNHVLSIALWGHNMDRSPLHHQVQVWAKITGSTAPLPLMLDVADVDWQRLRTAEEVQA